MKKELPINDRKILKFLLEQQLPDARVAGIGSGRDGKAHAAASTAAGIGGAVGAAGTTVDDAIAVQAVDHVTQVALETCRCVHLQEHLPHLLDLELCKAVHHPRGWLVANPVHSMHLQTQLEDSVPAMAHNKQPPVLYGEEQQRTMALNTEGIVEYWCPLDGYSAVIHDDTAVEKMEHMPTLQNIHKPTPLPLPPPPSAPVSVASFPVSVKQQQVQLQQQPHHQHVSSLPPPPTLSSSHPTAATGAEPSSSSSAIAAAHPSKIPGAAPSSTTSMALSGTTGEVATAAPSVSSSSTSTSDTPVPTATTSATAPEGSSQPEPKLPSSVGETPTTDPVGSNDKTLQEPRDKAGEATNNTAAAKDATTTKSPSSSGLHSPAVVAVPAPSAPDAAVSDETDRIAIVTSTTPGPITDALPPDEDIPLALPEEKFNHLRIEEDRIRLIRRSLSSHRILPKKKLDPKKRVDPKKKRKREDLYKAAGIPGWHASNPKELTQEQENQWLEAKASSRAKVERWMENFRVCRETFWNERERQASSPSTTDHGSFYLPADGVVARRCCETCSARPQGDRYWDGISKNPNKPRRKFCGDELMQCLECNFVGCSPQSIARDSKQHILQHLLLSGHKFAVSCGERGQLFCFCCGDFVYHAAFEQEKARIDYSKRVALMAWKPHKLYRSFDPFHFMKTQDHGIVWRGLVATYPQLVPPEHIRATEATSRRQTLFNGEVQEIWLANRPGALSFAASQSLRDDAARHRIQAPVGMYNLGNTCYKSAVLQCLVHCQPLQHFFLKESGHNHHACKVYRRRDANKRKKKKATSVKPEESICLACEMDRLYLSYYGSTIGVDVRGAVEEACSKEISDTDVVEVLEQGDPLVISEMLTASWKSGGMSSLASYKQHDSHEFMNSFLEMVGKQTKQHWARVLSSINVVKSDNAIVDDATESEHDIVKSLFEGSLSSVLLCEECGTKRKRTEEFLNVSLSLSEEVARRQSAEGRTKSALSVEGCLERFVMPEKLGDSVSCPSCAKKTSTQKQHTFGTLPKVLCLHLKRFDAALNKKIDDFVSFPAQGLNMGKYLAQWCEVSSLTSSDPGRVAEPQVYYDLFGTVNHVGNMQSGHYVTNVKVNGRWYHFNDAHVSLAGGDGGEQTVVNNAGAYILFYVRRDERPFPPTG